MAAYQVQMFTEEDSTTVPTNISGLLNLSDTMYNEIPEQILNSSSNQPSTSPLTPLLQRINEILPADPPTPAAISTIDMRALQDDNQGNIDVEMQNSDNDEGNSEAEELAKIYREDGTVVNLKKRKLTEKQKELRKRPGIKLKGEVAMKYESNDKRRSKARFNHLEGCKKSMQKCKTTTKDELLLFHYKNFKF